MTAPTITQANADHEVIAHITAVVVAVRPDWPAHLVAEVLRSHAHQVHAADLAVAAVRAAANPDFHTPKTIGWRGPHWDGARTMPADIAPRARCGVCGKREPQCVTQRPGRDDDHVFEAAS